MLSDEECSRCDGGTPGEAPVAWGAARSGQMALLSVRLRRSMVPVKLD